VRGGACEELRRRLRTFLTLLRCHDIVHFQNSGTDHNHNLIYNLYDNEESLLSRLGITNYHSMHTDIELLLQMNSGFLKICLAPATPFLYPTMGSRSDPEKEAS